MKFSFSYLCHVIFLFYSFSIFIVFLLDNLIPHESKGECLKTKWAVSVKEPYLHFGVPELDMS